MRRGSTWGGAGGLQAPAGIQTVKDPRPLRDKQYQARMRQDILAYLQANEFDITMSTLANIQGKEYRSIFEFLILTMDPYHMFTLPRFEDEFVPALKAVRYPFAHLIDNKWLAAPASMHSWPSLLGCLHWLVEMCKVCCSCSMKRGCSDSYFSCAGITLTVNILRFRIHLGYRRSLTTHGTTLP